MNETERQDGRKVGCKMVRALTSSVPDFRLQSRPGSTCVYLRVRHYAIGVLKRRDQLVYFYLYTFHSCIFSKTHVTLLQSND